MAPLKAGTVAHFSQSMAEAIEQALEKELQAVKGISLPATNIDERRMLFTAIATGIFSYLAAHQNELITTITLQSGDAVTTATVTALSLNLPP